MHRLLQDGWSKRRIAVRLGISRNTLERYLALGDGRSNRAGDRTSKLARCLEWLSEQAEGCSADSEALRRRLEAEKKIKVSRRTMQRALKGLQERKDYKTVRLPAAERARESQSVVLTLATSGWRIGPYQLSCSGELSLADSRIEMAEAQKQLLLIFARTPNRLIEQKQIETQLWPGERMDQDRTRTIRLCVHRLRQVFANGPLGGDVIRNVYGKGYVFHAPVEVIPSSGPIPAAGKIARLEEGGLKVAPLRVV